MKSFFEIKKVGDKFELFLHKEIDGKMNALLVKRSEDVRWQDYIFESLIEMCRLNSVEFGHLQQNAKPKVIFPKK